MMLNGISNLLYQLSNQLVPATQVEPVANQDGLFLVGQKLFGRRAIDESTHAEIGKYKLLINRLENENVTEVIYTIIESLKDTFNKDCEIINKFERQFALRSDIPKEIEKLKKIQSIINKFFIEAMNHFNPVNRDASSIMSDDHWVRQINEMVLSKSSTNCLCLEKIYLKIDLINYKA